MNFDWFNPTIKALYTGICGAIGGAFISPITNDYNQLVDSIDYLETLRIECDENGSDGQDYTRRPIPVDELKKAKNNSYLRKHYPKLLVLCKEAVSSTEGFKRVNDIQPCMRKVVEEIDIILPILKTRTSLWGYLWWEKRFIINLIIAVSIFYFIYSYPDYAISFWEKIKQCYFQFTS